MKKFLVMICLILSGCCANTSENCQSPLYPSTNGNVPICDSIIDYYACQTFENKTWEEFSQFCFDNGEESPALDVQSVGSMEYCWRCE